MSRPTVPLYSVKYPSSSSWYVLILSFCVMGWLAIINGQSNNRFHEIRRGVLSLKRTQSTYIMRVSIDVVLQKIVDHIDLETRWRICDLAFEFDDLANGDGNISPMLDQIFPFADCPTWLRPILSLFCKVFVIFYLIHCTLSGQGDASSQLSSHECKRCENMNHQHLGM